MSKVNSMWLGESILPHLAALIGFLWRRKIIFTLNPLLVSGRCSDGAKIIVHRCQTSEKFFLPSHEINREPFRDNFLRFHFDRKFGFSSFANVVLFSSHQRTRRRIRRVYDCEYDVIVCCYSSQHSSAWETKCDDDEPFSAERQESQFGS